jgi:hypothetical protein
MAQPSFGLGAGITVPATGITVRFRDRAYAGVTLVNTGATDCFVLINVLITGAANTSAVLDDIASSSLDAKVKTYSTVQAVANGILLKAGATLIFSGYEPGLGNAGIRRVSLITAAGTTTVAGGSTDIT